MKERGNDRGVMRDFLAERLGGGTGHDRKDLKDEIY